MSKVWVIQEGKNDYSAAEEFGEVVFITRDDVIPVENSMQNARVIHDIKRFLTEYIPGQDYIVPAGNPILISMIMMSLPFTEHKLLKWDGRRAVYLPHKVSRESVS